MPKNQPERGAGVLSRLLRPDYTRFFIPLAVQAMAQSLSHPLVAMVASRAPGGTLNMAGVSQASSFSYLIQTLSMGLLATGMVYGRSREGFRAFLKAWVILGVVTAAIGGFFVIPFFSHILFGRIIGLPPSIEAPARVAFAVGLPVRMLFQLRTPFHMLLLNNLKSSKSGAAAVIRVVMTLFLAPVFIRLGLVGAGWSQVCLGIPVAMEVVALFLMGRPYLRVLKSDPERPPPPVGRLLRFTMPLSLSDTLSVVSGSVLAAFIARAPNPEQVLPVYHLALSVVSPVIFAVSQIQRVVLAFAPECLRRKDTLRFTVAMGILGGLLPLVFQLEPLRTIYFVRMQSLSSVQFGALRMVALMMIIQPVLIALRSRLQGIASYRHTTLPVLFAYAALLLVLAGVGAVSLGIGIPGLVIGPLGILFGNLTAIIFMALTVGRRETLMTSGN